MEGTAKALATILLGTTVQLDQSAHWNDHPTNTKQPRRWVTTLI